MNTRNERPTPKNVGISLPEDVLLKGQERAARFRMKFSHYLAWLIEQDYERASKTITIRAKPKQ